MAAPLTNQYNDFITIESVREKADGKLSLLRFGIKDNIDVKGIATTAASKILAGNIARANAPVIDRILAEGGEIIGKTNMHEFAIGATTTSTAAGPCKNPHDQGRICGGSSGGSAACVAAGEADIGIGTDTGGSVRLPAALCGVIGFKPTTGSIPDAGVIPLSKTLDTVGVLARDVGDIRLVFRQICSKGPSLEEWHMPDRRLKFGLYAFGDDEVSAELMKFAEGLKGDYEIVNADFPRLSSDGARIRRTVSSYEAARYHEKWLREREGDYFPDVLRVLKYGASITDDQYGAAVQELRQLREEFEEQLKGYDAILSPTVKEIAPRIADVLGHEADYRRLLSVTELFNATGSPSISLPVASLMGLPLGLLVSCGFGEDMKTLDIAASLMGMATTKVPEE